MCSMFVESSPPGGIFTGHKQVMEINLVNVIPLDLVKLDGRQKIICFPLILDKKLVVCPYVLDAQGTPLIYEIVQNRNWMNLL